jgi:hypothetical protein
MAMVFKTLTGIRLSTANRGHVIWYGWILKLFIFRIFSSVEAYAVTMTEEIQRLEQNAELFLEVNFDQKNTNYNQI